MRLLKNYFFILLFLTAASGASAQKGVSLEVNGPALVPVGRAFKIEFTTSAKPDRFSGPVFNGFDVIAGPSEAVTQNVSFSNGNLTSSQSYIYSYVIVANTPGVYTVPAASVTVDGKEYKSKPLSIEAVEEGSAAGGQAGTRQGRGESGAEAQSPIQKDDILLRVSVDKTSVYKGQPVRVTLKIYHREIPIAGFENPKYPAFNGFWVQELDTDHYVPQRETLNGRVYVSEVLREYLLFPQQAGTLQIEQASMTAIAQIVVQTRGRTPLDEFFGGIPDIKQVSKYIASAPVNIRVNDLPAGAPDGFSGAVGNFTISSEVSSSEVGANSSFNYNVTISGAGNLPLIQAPKVNMPESFEQYDIKTTESLRRNASGISGYRQFEYPVIPRAEGDYTVDPVRFAYFDPQQASYVTLTTPEQRITVLPDAAGGSSAAAGTVVSGLNREELKILSQDIRFIKVGASGLALHSGAFMGSLWYFIILAIIAASFVFALIFLQKRIEQRRNEALVKGKRANKVALQRLRAAEKYMQEGVQRNFYEEMLKALWGYMADKLNIPAANLTKENVREELLRRGVDAEFSSRYIELITECEYAQYSPAASGQMNDLYRDGLKLISKFESLIKK